MQILEPVEPAWIIRAYCKRVPERSSGGGYGVSLMKGTHLFRTSLGVWWVVLEQGQDGVVIVGFVGGAFRKGKALDPLSVVFSSVFYRVQGGTAKLTSHLYSIPNPPPQKCMRPQPTKLHIPKLKVVAS